VTTLLIRARLTALVVGAALIVSTPTHAQQQTRWYVSTIGTDTLSIQRIERSGNTINGLWVTYHGGADRHRDILRHEYTITLAANGRPSSVHLQLRRPDSTVIRTYDARFTDDSAVITQTPDTLPPHTIAAHRGLPVLGTTMPMFELMIAAARSGKQAPDSAAIVAVPVTGPFIAQTTPIALLSATTVRFGPPAAPTIFVAPAGTIDSLVMRDGTVLMRRVDAFAIDAIALAASRGTHSGRD
jgi:hypothetical protein